VEVYKREARGIVGRFLAKRLGFPDCIAALDAALAKLIPRLSAEQLIPLRAVMLANNEIVMGEMEAREQVRVTEPVAHFKCWYVCCKECGRRITLETYTGESVARDYRDETLECPECRTESAYSGDDFKDSA
jgi:hypothetical protein